MRIMVSLAHPPAAQPMGLAGFATGSLASREQDADLAAARFRSRYAQRIRTSCVYALQAWGSYGVLVVQSPQFRGSYSPFQEWCPGLAPHRTLTAAYEAGALFWEVFAATYLAELQAFPLILAEARRRVAKLLDTHHLLTLLGYTSAPGGDESRVQCHRRILRAWLLGLEVPDIAPCALGHVPAAVRTPTTATCHPLLANRR